MGPYLPSHPQTHRGREGWKERQGKTKKTNSKSCNDRTGSSQDNQEGCGHPRTPPSNQARPPYLGALQLAVVSDHEGLLRAENARTPASHGSRSEFCHRCTVTYKGCSCRGCKLADCGLQPACRHIVFCLH